MRSITLVSKSFIVVVAGVATAALAMGASPAAAQSGGTVGPSVGPAPSGTAVPGVRAKLRPNGVAIAPADAPQQVKDAIAAGNRIRKKPYVYGGGHASFKSRGYDCSGAVSYVLNAAGLLSSPMPSGSFVNWGEPGKGSWITTYANGGHMYAVIAGLRWDTSAMGSGGRGPRWRATKRSPSGFSVRHYSGF